MTENTTLLISYIPDQSEYTSWATAFIDAFRNSILTFFTIEPRIVTTADETIPNDIQACIILAPVSDIDSDGWKKELARIRTLLKDNKDIPLFIVYQAAAASTEMKSLMKGQHSYRFFDTDPDTRQPRQYRQDGTSTELSLFWSLLIDIHYDLFDVILKPGKPDRSTEITTVYIAPATPELVVVRNRLVRELIQRKIRVYPDYLKDPSLLGTDAGFENLINECDLLVHLIGYQYGETVPGMECSFSEYYCIQTAEYCLENAEAIKQKGQAVVRLLCLPMQPDKADERQQQFIHSLRYDEATAFTEVVQLPVEDLKLLILERLLRKKNLKNATPEEKTVYLIYEPQSPGQVQKVSSVLKENGMLVKTLNYLENKISLTDQHRNNLSLAETVIIFDNNAPGQWVMSKIKDVVKAPGIGRQNPFRSKAIVTNNQERLKDIAQHNGFALLTYDDAIGEQLKTWIDKIQS